MRALLVAVAESSTHSGGAGPCDREIAEQLCLSRYTVHQYVKRIYRKLDVDSRVALTRLLLGLPIGARRS